MKRTSLLVTSTVITLVATAGASMAQQERIPQQDRNAPAEKVAPQNAPGVHNQAPNGRVGEPQNRSRTETTGQAPREGQQDRRGERNSEQNRSRTETTGQAPREGQQDRRGERNSEQERGKTEEPQRSQRNEQNRGGQAPREDRLNRAPEQNRTTGQAPREDRTNRSSEQNRQEQEQERIDRPQENRATTGQGAAGTRANINLTPEKRTRIHEVIVGERNAPRVSSPNFDISIGTRVPRTVRFAALPRTIVEIEPTWRGFEYFMVGDQIVIVDPRSMEIVAVLEA